MTTRQAEQLTLIVNGQPQHYAGQTVAALLAELNLAERKEIAVAVNGAVVWRQSWASTALQPGDRVEVIAPCGGG